MNFKQGVNNELIITIGAVSGFLVIVLAIGMQAWFLSEEQQELNEKYASSVNYQLRDLLAEQKKNLTIYRWIDKDNRVVAIPIDDAMELLIKNNGKLPSTRPR